MMGLEKLSNAPCHVCGAPLGAADYAACNGCGGLFHWSWSGAPAADDCGIAWLDEQYLVLEYACNVCLGRAAGQEPPVGRGH
jgi:hypothetical protein